MTRRKFSREFKIETAGRLFRQEGYAGVGVARILEERPDSAHTSRARRRLGKN